MSGNLFNHCVNRFCEADSSSPRSFWVPSAVVENAGGKSVIDLRTHHFTNRKVYLTGEIMDESADDFILQMQYLAEEREPVTIYINSPGGSVNAGLVIYDVVNSLKGKLSIHMYCVGMAASMAAIILAGGQKGRRYILPNSKVMIHEPLIAGGMGGSASSVKKTADSILKTKALTNSILAKHTGKTVEEIDEATAYDNYMTAKEAVAFGICDEIRNLF